MPVQLRQKKNLGIGLSKKKSYPFECPLRGDPSFACVCVSKSCISFEYAAAILEPSGENDTLWTDESTVNVDWQLPVDVSHIFTVLSPLALATCLPSGLNATEKILRLR